MNIRHRKLNSVIHSFYRSGIRTHRLIERGAILESFIPNAGNYDNKVIQQFLSTVLTEKSCIGFL